MSQLSRKINAGKLSVIVLSLVIILSLIISYFTHVESKPDALTLDAQVYAKDNRVSVTEALRRLELQKVVGALNAELSSTQPGTFAGLWIQHSPEFRVVIQYTNNPETTIRPYLARELSSMVEMRQVKSSLSNLQSVQVEAVASFKNIGVHVDSSIDIPNNRVEIETPEVFQLDSVALNKQFKLPENVVIKPVKSLAKPTGDLYGGISLEGVAGGSTAGFSVVDANGTRGITTCGHTDFVLFYMKFGVPFWLPCQKSRRETYYDVQWHSGGTFNVLNQIVSSSTDTREITGQVSRADQAIGSFVGKYGKTTGYTAGYISRNNVVLDYIPDCEPTFIEVEHSESYPKLCDSGDSGGPWFVGNDAWGTTCAKDTSGNAYYMAINYISGLGVNLLTSP